jgi:hypothetical protein
MIWNSLNRYIPPSCENVFIRAVLVNTDEEHIYDRFFVAKIEDFRKVYDLEEWEMANGEVVLDIDLSMYVVTHFAVIDPVEVEE